MRFQIAGVMQNRVCLLSVVLACAAACVPSAYAGEYGGYQGPDANGSYFAGRVYPYDYYGPLQYYSSPYYYAPKYFYYGYPAYDPYRHYYYDPPRKRRHHSDR